MPKQLKFAENKGFDTEKRSTFSTFSRSIFVSQTDTILGSAHERAPRYLVKHFSTLAASILFFDS